ncbi:MAG: class I adenylate-forming enzyme family protein, partial [Actinomycetota bacterium]|nr:class I adenylate-forming enzyme family protein [Actinomycetota bacterium]
AGTGGAASGRLDHTGEVSGPTIPNDATAVVVGEGPAVTRGDLRRLVDAIEASLRALDIGGGDRVATTLPAGPELVALAVAVERCDASLAVVSPTWWPAEIADALASTAPALVVTGPRGDGRVDPPDATSPPAPLARLTSSGALVRSSPPKPAVATVGASPVDRDPTGWSATSGAHVPGRLVRHRSPVPPPTPEPIAVAVDPSAAGLARRLAAAFTAGEPVVLAPRLRDTDDLAALAARGVRRLWASAAQLDELATALRRNTERPHGAIGASAAVAGLGITAFGTALRPGTAELVGERLGVPIEIAYALAEVGGPLAVRDAATAGPGADLAPLALGRPVEGWELAVDERTGPERSGPMLLARPVGGAEPLVATDDVVVPTSSSPDPAATSLRLRGPAAAAFEVDGEVVHPAEVELALAGHPAVAQVTVVPRPDPRRGAFGVAVVVPVDPEHPPFLEELVEGWAADAPSRPGALTIVDRIRLTGSGVPHHRFLRYEEARRQRVS